MNPANFPLPSPGLGTWKTDPAILPGLIYEALTLGYRHLDCACDYGNEAQVGTGLKKAFAEKICRREELHLTSKLWNTYHRPEHIRAACERSLADLGVNELDLYLLHFPISLAFVPFEKNYPPGWFFDPEAENPAMKPDHVPLAETWGAMEELIEAGLVKNIGVCNLTTGFLRDLLASARLRPQVLQVELHPYLTQNKLVRFCHEEKITVTAYSPFGADSYLSLGMAEKTERVLEDPVLVEIAAVHEATPAQIALAWAMQRGTVPVPKASSIAHLRENLAARDLSLSEGEMARISELDRHRRFNDPGEFAEKAFNTFFPIFD